MAKHLPQKASNTKAQGLNTRSSPRFPSDPRPSKPNAPPATLNPGTIWAELRQTGRDVAHRLVAFDGWKPSVKPKYDFISGCLMVVMVNPKKISLKQLNQRGYIMRV